MATEHLQWRKMQADIEKRLRRGRTYVTCERRMGYVSPEQQRTPYAEAGGIASQRKTLQLELELTEKAVSRNVLIAAI